MSEFNRILNLDADNEIQVTLGGRSLVIRQQRRALIDKILLLANDMGQYVEMALKSEDEKREAAEKKGEESDATTYIQEVIQHSGETWERSLPTFALIFGVEPADAEYDDLLKHLTEHLSFAKAERVYTAWHELNEVRRFFDLRGNPLISSRVYEENLAARQAAVAAAVENELSKSE